MFLLFLDSPLPPQGGVQMPSLDTIYNMGAFGALLVLVFAAFFKGIPYAFKKHEAVIATIVQNGKETTLKHIEDNKIAITVQATAHKAAVERIVSTFEEESKKHQEESRECRQERMDTAKLFASEQEKNRLDKHQLSNEFQKAIATLTLASNQPPKLGPHSG